MTDGYLGGERIRLHDGGTPRRGRRPAPVHPAGGPKSPGATAHGVVSGVVSNVRKDSQPYGQNVNWQIVTFEVEERDNARRSGARVAVELRGLSLRGPVPADGAVVRAYGRFNRDGVFEADRVVDTRTGHTLRGRMRRAAKALQLVVMAVVLVIFSVVAAEFATGGRLFDQFAPGSTGDGQQKTVVVPDLSGMNESEALTELEQDGFTGFDYRIVQKDSASVRFGCVIGTEPPSGSSVTVGGHTPVVYVHVSVGAAVGGVACHA